MPVSEKNGLNGSRDATAAFWASSLSFSTTARTAWKETVCEPFSYRFQSPEKNMEDWGTAKKITALYRWFPEWYSKCTNNLMHCYIINLCRTVIRTEIPLSATLYSKCTECLESFTWMTMWSGGVFCTNSSERWCSMKFVWTLPETNSLWLQRSSKKSTFVSTPTICNK